MGLINITGEEFQEDKYMFTKYSLFHFSYGFLWYIVFYSIFGKKHTFESFALMNIFHAIFEIVENTPFAIEIFRKNPLWKDYLGDSKGNSCGDIISGILGFFLAYFIFLYKRK